MKTYIEQKIIHLKEKLTKIEQGEKRMKFDFTMSAFPLFRFCMS